MRFPKLAKLHQKQLGTFESDYSRAISGDIHATYLALDALTAKISDGTNVWRQRIPDLG